METSNLLTVSQLLPLSCWSYSSHDIDGWLVTYMVMMSIEHPASYPSSFRSRVCLFVWLFGWMGGWMGGWIVVGVAAGLHVLC
ncbi:hypothetical protein BDW42DRAFT_164894 [Aspergillus taichungensis]|uniref:Uncharacterized protein n=1 Tax=Aspergillus taichungensis TaxID=482145 RepID=A0A2J5I0V4_9EURO|nr:hypothetical protein BDW42DRAFT_164894 [Aspergillus taichungensis]